MILWWQYSYCDCRNNTDTQKHYHTHHICNPLWQKLHTHTYTQCSIHVQGDWYAHLCVGETVSLDNSDLAQITRLSAWCCGLLLSAGNLSWWREKGLWCLHHMVSVGSGNRTQDAETWYSQGWLHSSKWYVHAEILLLFHAYLQTYWHTSVSITCTCLVCRMLQVWIPSEAAHYSSWVVSGHSCFALPCLVDWVVHILHNYITCMHQLHVHVTVHILQACVQNEQE